MDNSILLFSYSKEEIRTLIVEIVAQTLREYHRKEPPPFKEPNEYLTRNQVISLLKISLSTLNYYTKAGILRSYRIGGRVLYKKQEVHHSIKEVQSSKFKRRG